MRRMRSARAVCQEEKKRKGKEREGLSSINSLFFFEHEIGLTELKFDTGGKVKNGSTEGEHRRERKNRTRLNMFFSSFFVS